MARPKPTQALEHARPNGDKRIVRVRLKVINGNNGPEIITELENANIEEIFNSRDYEDFPDLVPVQAAAKANTDRRKNTALPANQREVVEGQRINTDDYKTEPPYIHAGIHLVGRTADEIEWFSDQRINFIIDVGEDPQLHLVRANLAANVGVSTASLKASANAAAFSPFIPAGDPYPKTVVNGRAVRSGALKLQQNGHLHDDVAAQKYYKFTVTVLGTDITLDPHIDCHDD